MSKLPVLLVTASLALVACGGGQARPLPPEEPMDHSGDSASSSSSSTSSSTSTTSASDNSADPSAAFSGVDPSAMNAATPTPTPDPTPAPDPKGKGGKGKKGKGGDDASAGGGGGQLSQSECSALSDKGVELFAASMGITDPSMTAQLKATAAGDPNFSKMQTECTKSTTRAQYKCGMAAKSKDAWEACLK